MMRRLVLVLLALFCLVGAFLLLKKERKVSSSPIVTVPHGPVSKPAGPVLAASGSALNHPGFGFLSSSNGLWHASKTNWQAYRLQNTDKSVGQLARQDHAILLENALIDTESGLPLTVPNALKSGGDPRAYIIQSRTAPDDQFRNLLARAGGAIISYIPNNAYLVRISSAAAAGLRGDPTIQSVVAYDPYFKIKRGLLKMAVEGRQLPENAELNVLLFSDKVAETTRELNKMGIEVPSQVERTPFGPLIKIHPRANGWTAVASLTGVQAIEPVRRRVSANDLSRERIGVAVDSVAQQNYLGLTGSNVLVNINDTGVDTNHPDLQGRITVDSPASGYDTSGHGTHVAGIIASSGANSGSVTNASGSIMPPGTNQFRGMAPGARLFAMSVDSDFGPFGSDAYLQETAAITNALISNNSWDYFADSEYDLAAASYDAAVRDALPLQTGSHPAIYVFAAGNDGGGDRNGTGGNSDTILSPATAKNVITVGAIEQLRNVTNDVRKCIGQSTNQICSTNKPWVSSTDSDEQVAGFSSRGNVGIGIEGDFGRFKPDVVTPGTFVVSTRSTTWDEEAYYDPTSHIFQVYPDLTLNTNDNFGNIIYVPDNAVAMRIATVPNGFSPSPFPNLLIYMLQTDFPSPTNFTFFRTNEVQMPPDGGTPLQPTGVNWFYSIYNKNNFPVSFDLVTDIVLTNELGNYFEVLSNLNNALGPFYRYESGTSMAAGSASGTLALMQEFFEQRMFTTNSPALMKALLINGSRSAGNLYDLSVQNSINLQGWGVVNLANSIPGSLTNPPAAAKSSLIFDQSSTNALATGQKHTRLVKVANAALDLPLRVTLVWTDPPGNPVAGTKLVNDLDLVVTNLDTGEVFFGNDIVSGTDFNLPWDTNAVPNLDVINNVENVYLSPFLGTNYSITVVGKRVNVNAVTDHNNGVVQDYALVIASGNGEIANALTLATDQPTVSTNLAFITVVTNSFEASPTDAGGILLNQRAGASSPLLGTNTIAEVSVKGQITIGVTNQWQFYVVSNSTTFTNAAFVTFLPPTLSMSPVGTREFSVDNATRFEADIDLYVSTDANLTNLTPGVLQASRKSISRGGTEAIIYSNAVPGAVYYVAIKSEDQMAAQYGFLGVFSLLPFGSSDAQGNQTLRGFPAPATIPDGGPNHPGSLLITAIGQPVKIKRVVVTNIISHELMGDLMGTLLNSRDFAVLNNHAPEDSVTNRMYVYDDSERKDTLLATHSDGPGSLKDFAGKTPSPVWQLNMVDNAQTHVGTNEALYLWLEKQQDLTNGVTITLQPGECDEEFIDVPVTATNMEVILGFIQGAGPISMQVCPVDGAASDCTSNYITAAGATVVINKSSIPPLNAGTYRIRVCNLGTDSVTLNLRVKLDLDLRGIVPTDYRSAGPVTIRDDATTYSTIDVTNDQRIVSVEVGLRVDHPRVSDLSFHLISPNGTRLLLFENRGALSTNGMGNNLISTNIVPVSSTGGSEASTNSIDTGLTSGTISIDYDFFGIPDQMLVIYENTVLTNTGMIAGSGTLNLTYGPGSSTVITIVMNPFGNTNLTTAWTYTVKSTTAAYAYLTFTEDTNKTITPIKFAIPPFGQTNTGSSSSPKVLFSSFDSSPAGFVKTPNTVDQWTVTTNRVSVINNPAQANGGSQFLSLLAGQIERSVATTVGKGYTITCAAQNPSNCISFPTFSPASGLNIQGDANLSGSLISLNHTNTSTEGSVYNPEKMQVTSGFDTTFQFRISNLGQASGYQPGAEGIAFAIQNISGTDPRSSIGAAGALNIFINTYQNAPNELSDNSVTIVLGGSQLLLTAVNLTPLGIIASDGGIHTCHISYSGTAFTIAIDSQTVLSNYVLPIAPYADSCGNAWVGLTAACGLGAWEAHQILSWSFCSTAPVFGAQMSIPGIITNVVPPATSWVTNSISFIAATNSTRFSVAPANCSMGMFLDSFTISESSQGTNIFSLPETDLSILKDEIASGRWTLEVTDSRSGPSGTNVSPTLLGWQLSFVFATELPKPIALPPQVSTSNSIPAGQILYYVIDVPPWASFATNRLISSTAPVNVLFNQFAPPTGTNAGDVTLIANQSNGTSTLVTNGIPALTPGTYYIGIQNTNAASVTVSFEVDFDITPLTKNIPVTGQISTILPRYFYYDVSPNATEVSFQLTNQTGDANLVIHKGLPYPTPGSYDYASFNPGTFDDVINVFTNSDPVPLTPGRWYIGVYNASGLAVTSTVVVTEFSTPVPLIITLFNQIPYANTNLGVGPNTFDYYRYVVSTNAARAQFEVNSPSADVTLLLHRNLPLPTAGIYDYASGNSGTNDELIVVYNYSSPVPVGPGEWFLGVMNVSGGSVQYSVKASESQDYGTNLVILSSQSTSNSLCLTWNSIPGAHYFIQGRPDLNTTNWFVSSPNITAGGPTTTYCVPLPSTNHFFRVREGLGQGNPFAGFAAEKIDKVVANSSAIAFTWKSAPGNRFQIEWTSSLQSGQWHTLSNIITSVSGDFFFTESFEQSPGIATRFYRLKLAP